ncbi:hypothetical protein HNQ34_001777 [Anoxybacillus tepidamans]|uniref:Uncharacterized protein n=1 Tax=Anoxybacteroides tepidamans TaxID=265948 RepID=A0A7W8IQD6_9BACL|nr:hypothetical protein [Anoxybacillus tepidamans]MBB5324679.1 hypothetical protein [Anoxybacillus tepidamans]
MNVLRDDKELANELVQCCDYSLFRARTAFFNRSLDIHGRLAEAERWMHEFMRCKRDLDELVRKKEEHDKLVQLVEVMKERGIDIAVIVRKSDGQ